MKIDTSILNKFIEENIHEFHDKRIARLLSLKLDDLLKRKNPYLFKAKSIITAQELVEGILQAYLSSQEEAIFGEILEKLAIFVNGIIYGGTKSSAEGIDLEFEKDDIKYIVSIKSGPHWGNSSQIAKMQDHFKKAKRILGTNTTAHNVVAVNGCCYSRDNKPDKGGYLKLCGQEFWAFITGDEEFYKLIIEPIGYKAQEKNEEFNIEYKKVINKFTRDFANNYCSQEGSILWDRLLEFNSAKQKS